VTLVLLGIGLVLIVEGLALALAPLRIEQVLAFFAGLSRDQRRFMGLVAMGLGVALVALSKGLGAG
jgi:uncharacterized protein YjeT (DUF2065 family)